MWWMGKAYHQPVWCHLILKKGEYTTDFVNFKVTRSLRYEACYIVGWCTRAFLPDLTYPVSFSGDKTSKMGTRLASGRLSCRSLEQSETFRWSSTAHLLSPALSLQNWGYVSTLGNSQDAAFWRFVLKNWGIRRFLRVYSDYLKSVIGAWYARKLWSLVG